MPLRINIWVEEGYGLLIIEMGILAPFLWLLWTGALMITGWQVLRRLRQTRLFPIGFAILWYAFLLLYPLTFRRHGPIPEFRYQRLSLASRGHSIPAASSPHARTQPGHRGLSGSGKPWWTSVLSVKKESDVRDCGGRRL